MSYQPETLLRIERILGKRCANDYPGRKTSCVEYLIKEEGLEGEGWLPLEQIETMYENWAGKILEYNRAANEDNSIKFVIECITGKRLVDDEEQWFVEWKGLPPNRNCWLTYTEIMYIVYDDDDSFMEAVSKFYITAECRETNFNFALGRGAPKEVWKLMKEGRRGREVSSCCNHHHYREDEEGDRGVAGGEHAEDLEETWKKLRTRYPKVSVDSPPSRRVYTTADYSP